MAKKINVCGGGTVFIPGSGEGCDMITKNISANGTYNAASDLVDGYSSVIVDVPNSYTDADEGKVVDDGALVAQGSQTITQNGTYDTTLISELIANVSGGGKNILSGVDVPTANLGENGDIYLQLTSYDLQCDEEYLVNSTTQRLSTQSDSFYKITDGPAVAVHYKNGGYYGPILISPSIDAVKYNHNLNPTISKNIDGVTWYISTTQYWNGSTDSPTIPTMYNLGLAINDTNAEAIIRAIITASNAEIVSSVDGFVNDTYCKVNGVWRPLAGTNINDVNTGGE